MRDESQNADTMKFTEVKRASQVTNMRWVSVLRLPPKDRKTDNTVRHVLPCPCHRPTDSCKMLDGRTTFVTGGVGLSLLGPEWDPLGGF